MSNPWLRLSTHFSKSLIKSPTITMYTQYCEAKFSAALSQFKDDEEGLQAYLKQSERQIDEYLMLKESLAREEVIMDKSHANQGEDKRLIERAAGLVGLSMPKTVKD